MSDVKDGDDTPEATAAAEPAAPPSASASADADAPESPVDNVVRFDFKGGKTKAPAGPSQEELRDKLTAFVHLIDKGMVLVTMDARRAGVKVPAAHHDDMTLALNFSHRFYVQDFAYDAKGIRSTLTFRGAPFYCEIPWSAVYGLRSHVDGSTLLWPEDMPEELRQMVPEIARLVDEKRRADEQGKGPLDPALPPATGPQALPPLAPPADVAPADADKADGAGGPEDPRDPPEPPRRGGLRLVK